MFIERSFLEANGFLLLKQFFLNLTSIFIIIFLFQVRQLESEKRSLERKLHASRSKSYERGEKGSREWDVGDSVIGMGIGGGGGIGGSTNLLLEQENIELKARVRSLEAELSKKEAELLRLKSLDFSR